MKYDLWVMVPIIIVFVWQSFLGWQFALAGVIAFVMCEKIGVFNKTTKGGKLIEN